jgi:hypothetical protein
MDRALFLARNLNIVIHVENNSEKNHQQKLALNYTRRLVSMQSGTGVPKCEVTPKRKYWQEPLLKMMYEYSMMRWKIKGIQDNTGGFSYVIRQAVQFKSGFVHLGSEHTPQVNGGGNSDQLVELNNTNRGKVIFTFTVTKIPIVYPEFPQQKFPDYAKTDLKGEHQQMISTMCPFCPTITGEKKIAVFAVAAGDMNSRFFQCQKCRVSYFEQLDFDINVDQLFGNKNVDIQEAIDRVNTVRSAGFEYLLIGNLSAVLVSDCSMQASVENISSKDILNEGMNLQRILL